MANNLLVINSQRISTFPTAKGPRPMDLFPVTKIDEKKSRYIKFADLSWDVVHRDIAQQNYSISSVWTFNNGLSATTTPKISTDIATVSWFYKNCYTPFVNLSTLMYGNSDNDFQAKRKPSYIGMVIVSKSISSQTTLRDIYGSNTSWKQIKGRFLLASGPNGGNTVKTFGNNTRAGDITIMAAEKTGGTPSVRLEEKHIVPHTHVFKTEQIEEKGEIEVPAGPLHYGEIPRIKGLIEPELQCENVYDIIQSDAVASSSDWGAGFAEHSSSVPNGVTATGHKTTIYHKHHGGLTKVFSGGLGSGSPDPKQWPTQGISIGDLLGGGVQEKRVDGTFQAKIEIGDMIPPHGQTDPHDNMPPYITRYFWERIL